MKPKSLIALATLGAALGGCTTFGTNINGSFRCDAPDGVCAPSTAIDDTALSRIKETSSPDLLNPAGPYQMDDGVDTPIHTITAAKAPAASRSAPSYELSVVFPGYTDAAGVSHARRIMRTRAALPGRGGYMDTMARRGAQPSRNRGLLAAAESAPPFLAIAPGVAGASLPPTGDEVAVQVAAADQPNRTQEIEAKVKERVSAHQKARLQATPFPGTVE